MDDDLFSLKKEVDKHMETKVATEKQIQTHKEYARLLLYLLRL